MFEFQGDAPLFSETTEVLPGPHATQHRWYRCAVTVKVRSIRLRGGVMSLPVLKTMLLQREGVAGSMAPY